MCRPPAVIWVVLDGYRPQAWPARSRSGTHGLDAATAVNRTPRARSPHASRAKKDGHDLRDSLVRRLMELFLSLIPVRVFSMRQRLRPSMDSVPLTTIDERDETGPCH